MQYLSTAKAAMKLTPITNNKRVMVRAINHVLHIDEHHMMMVHADKIEFTVTELFFRLQIELGFEFTKKPIDIVETGKQFGDVFHASAFSESWIIQIRVDSKQMVYPRVASNDN